MALICILISIIFERASDTLEKLRNFEWFDNYSRWFLLTFPRLTEHNRISIVILLLPILLLTAVLQGWFEGQLLGLIEMLFGLTIFAFCLGPKDLNRQIDNYLQAKENGDETIAQNEASNIMHKDAPADPDQQIVEVMRSILHEANDRFFSVIFWFVVLGPLGALMYRLTTHTMRTSENESLANTATQLQAIMAWAPAHLTAIGYALTGNYESAKQEFYSKTKQDNLTECNYLTLIAAGQGAIKDCTQGEETACIRSARALVLRTLIVWLSFIAILTLIGFMS